MIGKYIEEVEMLGDIGAVNMDRVCKIISRNRRLFVRSEPSFRADINQDCGNSQSLLFNRPHRTCHV